MANRVHSVWDDASYLASFEPDMATHPVRPDSWDPLRVLDISQRIDCDRDYEAMMLSCLSIVRPTWFGSESSLADDAVGHGTASADRSDRFDSAQGTLRCDARCDAAPMTSPRACCAISRLFDAAECDSALRLVVDGLPHRVTVRFGRWFVIGLRTESARLHCPGTGDVFLAHVGMFEGKSLHRLDQSIPLLPIEVLCASFWSVTSTPKRVTRSPSEQVPTTVVARPASNTARGA